jgi:hypothetical protein
MDFRCHRWGTYPWQFMLRIQHLASGCGWKWPLGYLSRRYNFVVRRQTRGVLATRWCQMKESAQAGES